MITDAIVCWRAACFMPCCQGDRGDHRQALQIPRCAQSGPLADFARKCKAAFRIFFPPRPKTLTPKEEGRNRLRMILVADRCAMNANSLVEMKTSIVNAVANYVEVRVGACIYTCRFARSATLGCLQVQHCKAQQPDILYCQEQCATTTHMAAEILTVICLLMLGFVICQQAMCASTTPEPAVPC